MQVRHRVNMRKCIVCDNPMSLNTSMERAVTECRSSTCTKLVQFLPDKNFSAKLARNKFTCIYVLPKDTYVCKRFIFIISYC